MISLAYYLLLLYTTEYYVHIKADYTSVDYGAVGRLSARRK